MLLSQWAVRSRMPNSRDLLPSFKQADHEKTSVLKQSPVFKERPSRTGPSTIDDPKQADFLVRSFQS